MCVIRICWIFQRSWRTVFISVKPKIAWDLILQVPNFVSWSVCSSALRTVNIIVLWWGQIIPAYRSFTVFLNIFLYQTGHIVSVCWPNDFKVLFDAKWMITPKWYKWHYIRNSRSFPPDMVLGCQGDLAGEIFNNLMFKAFFLARVLQTQMFLFGVASKYHQSNAVRVFGHT